MTQKVLIQRRFVLNHERRLGEIALQKDFVHMNFANQCSMDCMWHQEKSKAWQTYGKSDNRESDLYIALCFAGATKTMQTLNLSSSYTTYM